jgi:hypothetical protein
MYLVKVSRMYLIRLFPIAAQGARDLFAGLQSGLLWWYGASKEERRPRPYERLGRRICTTCAHAGVMTIMIWKDPNQACRAMPMRDLGPRQDWLRELLEPRPIL